MSRINMNYDDVMDLVKTLNSVLEDYNDKKNKLINIQNQMQGIWQSDAANVVDDCFDVLDYKMHLTSDRIYKLSNHIKNTSDKIKAKDEELANNLKINFI